MGQPPSWRAHTQLALRTQGYTGADIGALVREAGLAALEEDITIPHVSGACACCLLCKWRWCLLLAV